MSPQPRLLPDYAATPTPTERSAARRANRAAQLGMFDAIDDDHQADELAPCPVCASSEHDAEHCPHGTAAPMFEVVGVWRDRPDCVRCGTPLTGEDPAVTTLGARCQACWTAR